MKSTTEEEIQDPTFQKNHTFKKKNYTFQQKKKKKIQNPTLGLGFQSNKNLTHAAAKTNERED